MSPSSIYISHPVLHEKHPILKKLELGTLKLILRDSKVIYLEPEQPLYRAGSSDSTLYLVLFGRLQLRTLTDQVLGEQVISVGWTLGEEVLFDSMMQVRQESAVAATRSCLIGLAKERLTELQKTLLEGGNETDYFIIESLFKGNYLIKDQWRREYAKHGGQY